MTEKKRIYDIPPPGIIFTFALILVFALMLIEGAVIWHIAYSAGLNEGRRHGSYRMRALEEYNGVLQKMIKSPTYEESMISDRPRGDVE